jgi:hypothetical protein
MAFVAFTNALFPICNSKKLIDSDTSENLLEFSVPTKY